MVVIIIIIIIIMHSRQPNMYNVEIFSGSMINCTRKKNNVDKVCE